MANANTASKNYLLSVIKPIILHVFVLLYLPYIILIANRLQNYMYGQHDAGFFGYSHFTGRSPGGQAEYVHVVIGEVNLLKVPNDILDEKAIYLSDVLAQGMSLGFGYVFFYCTDID